MKCTLMGLVGLLIFGFITMILWNWLVPVLFNGPVLTYWQALGLLALSKILTVGFWARPFRNHQPSSNFWKKRLHDKLSSLDPQEREVFKQRLKDKWCSRSQQSGPASND